MPPQTLSHSLPGASSRGQGVRAASRAGQSLSTTLPGQVVGGGHVLRQMTRLVPWQPGVWRWPSPGFEGMLAGTTDRTGTLDTLRANLPAPHSLIQAEQVHGASVAVIESAAPAVHPIAGCDALVTGVRGLALVVRTADCLPLFIWDPVRAMIGVAHVGWRGLVGQLPIRLVSVLQGYGHGRLEDLWVGIGPGIRACCFEVTQEFQQVFGSFVQGNQDRWTCDLVACAHEQLVRAGIQASHILDANHCTACDDSRQVEEGVSREGEHSTPSGDSSASGPAVEGSPRWHSMRREGHGVGRGFSFMLMSSRAR